MNAVESPNLLKYLTCIGGGEARVDRLRGKGTRPSFLYFGELDNLGASEERSVQCRGVEIHRRIKKKVISGTQTRQEKVMESLWEDGSYMEGLMLCEGLVQAGDEHI